MKRGGTGFNKSSLDKSIVSTIMVVFALMAQSGQAIGTSFNKVADTRMINRTYGGRILGIAIGISALVLLVSSAGASTGIEAISVNPTQGPAGSVVTVSGTGWYDHASRGLDVLIWIGFTVVLAHPDANGNFSINVTIPPSSPPGQLKISAIIGNGGSADAYFTVTPSAVSPTPTPTPNQTPTPTVSITANPSTHDTTIGTNFTFAANPIGPWGNNIQYNWSIVYDNCSSTGEVFAGQSFRVQVGCIGNSTISVTAEDEKGNVASSSYLLRVHEAVPDLTVTNISFSKDTLVAGEPVTINASIANIGTGDAKGDIYVLFSQVSHYTNFNDGNGKILIFSYRLEHEIKAGETIKVGTNWNAAPAETDNSNGFINVMVLSNITESNMDNNNMYKNVAINSERFYSAIKDGYHFENFIPTISEKFDMIKDIRSWIDSISNADPIDTLAISLINIDALFDSGGLSYGFSSTSILYNQNPILKPVNKDTFLMMRADQGVTTNILRYQALQAPHAINDIFYSISKPEPDIKTEYNKIAASIKTGQPVGLSIVRYHNGKSVGRHFVTAYDVFESDSIKNVIVYDSMFPGMARVMQFDFNKNDITYEDYGSIYDKFEAKYTSFHVPLATPTDTIKMLGTVLQELSKNIVNYLFNTGHTIFSFHSPVNVTIKDQYGRIANDEGINNIPGANIDTGLKMFVLPTNLDYTVNISAYDSGNFSMTQVYPLTNWSASVISFKNISMNKNTIATIDINSTNPNYTMKIDKNGDGIIDETKVPDSTETIVVDNTTSPSPLTLKASSSGDSSGSGGGGGGGGGGTTGENYTNIEVKEKYDLYIFKDKLTSYAFNRSNPILFVNITGNVNAGEITTIVEVLRNISSLVKYSSPGKVYKNVNIWIGTSGFAVPKNIKEAIITFRIENSWLDSNNLKSSDINMVRWDGSYWSQLETSQTIKDSMYTYYEAKTYAFSSFAIKGFSKAAPIAMPPLTTQSGIARTVTVAPADTGTPAGTGTTPSEGTPLINWSIIIVVFAMVGIIIAVYSKMKAMFKK